MIMMNSNSLWRANYNERKQTQYYSLHGQGRDGYILNSNGEDFKARLNPNSVSGKYFKIGNTYESKPYYGLKKLKYYSDGKGRDAYITYNSGGFFDDQGNNNNIFQQNLRQQEYQHFNKIQKITSKEIELYKQQKQLSKKLSKPRIINQTSELERLQEIKMNVICKTPQKSILFPNIK